MSKRSASNGGEDDGQLRTHFTQFFNVAVIMDDWGEGSVLLSPGSIRRALLKRTSRLPKFRFDSSKHILQISMEWKQQEAEYQTISSSDIAKQVGLSPGRVRQILRLSNLHPAVQAQTLDLIAQHGKSVVPERLLRHVQRLPLATQFYEFTRLLGTN
ncbi:hypothetical protein [Ruficoccus sp. ZRK36]|uniref:hypothetical protein n=1 Tax=Ruficoccus sp. ZRK36 TaxID=2866311 RepID=UPI001C73707E|nr:hypothetical protein [Ruficoccus sp. ZRK36]QYY34823.1 hypothetical protein K0V07_10980 [Ruficoccus sp. ZRK36]